jgi:hypothetical protein
VSDSLFAGVAKVSELQIDDFAEESDSIAGDVEAFDPMISGTSGLVALIILDFNAVSVSVVVVGGAGSVFFADVDVADLTVCVFRDLDPIDCADLFTDSSWEVASTTSERYSEARSDPFSSIVSSD